ncbi:peptidoglycan DD-metalloendopeptidase family protein [Saprospira sp. CCB-QB6]|uniref:peptidoglycan DD-metalloendopeptidase family protein n=1 Tax=Saprospira sp. CCB-QB6 TaxID=3023936 RepID=UPI00234915EA|nr:peptidoglycan DD-metalloendopeptidase family protein [Saprospira sp. CCB-QB6]WCL82109.1 peptidoglycan DD-metalloendopeptidase family protein [Saprospira sp. CCB-QB6]
MARVDDFLAWVGPKKGMFGNVVTFSPNREYAVAVDLSENNPRMAEIKTQKDLQNYIQERLDVTSSFMAIGGYLERRNLYRDKGLFNPEADPLDERCIHLGIDIWMRVGTRVRTPLAAKVHSKGYLEEEGNYGGVIILEHQPFNCPKFYTLYGHLSKASIEELQPGQRLRDGAEIGKLGSLRENGGWLPHLHFQIIIDLQGHSGDYPGVCSARQLAEMKRNSPDPNLILNSPLL